MSLNTQVKWNALRSLGYSGTQEDMELSFYLANGATSYSLRDAEMQFLTARGYFLGTIEDKWNAYLLAQGFVGVVSDMILEFWNDVRDILVDNLLLESGDALLQEDGSLIVINTLGSTLELNFINTSSLDPRITFTRTTTATRYNDSGLIESVAINGPRFDYDPVTLAPKGLLIEEQRTNLLTYSEQFDNAAWTKINSTATSNTIVSPDGTVDADLLSADATVTASARDFRRSTATTVSVANTFSVYAKAAAGNFIALSIRNASASANNIIAEFNLSSGTISIAASNNGNATGATAAIFAVGNGWYRCSISGIADTSGTSLTTLIFGRTTSNSTSVPENTNLCYIWGAQLEAGAFATSYIPTVASQVTRAADSAVMTGTNFSDWYNAVDGSLYSEASTYDVLNPRVGFAISDGTAANRIQAGHGSGARGFIAAGNVVQMSQSLVSVTFSNNTVSKVSLAYELNNGNAAANGTIGTLDTAMTIPTVTQARIGGLTATLLPLNGHVRRIAYYPRRLSDAELQGITS